MPADRGPQIPGGGAKESSSSGSPSLSGGVIGGIVCAVVIVIGIGVTIVVFVVRWRLGRTPGDPPPKKAQYEKRSTEMQSSLPPNTVVIIEETDELDTGEAEATVDGNIVYQKPVEQSDFEASHAMMESTLDDIAKTCNANEQNPGDPHVM